MSSLIFDLQVIENVLAMHAAQQSNQPQPTTSARYKDDPALVEATQHMNGIKDKVWNARRDLRKSYLDLYVEVTPTVREYPLSDNAREEFLKIVLLTTELYRKFQNTHQSFQSFDKELAGIGARFGAIFIDGIILGVISFVINLVIQSSIANPADYYSYREYNGAVSNALYVSSLVNFIIFLGYYGFFLSQNGKTPGKSAMHVRVVRTDGSPLSFGRAIGRTLATTISGVVLLIGYLVAFGDPMRQTWHDKIVGTVVIKD